MTSLADARPRSTMKLMRRSWTLLAALSIVCAAACARGRSYELNGQILAIDAARHEITIKHEDIKGFMPGMTMTFKVRDAKILDGRAAGDLIRGTLVVNDTEAYVQSIESTGRAPLTEAPPAGPRIDPMDPGESVPDASFVDSSGRPHRFSEWRGRTVALTFIYTRCPLPDFCPLMDRQFADVAGKVAASPRRAEQVRLLSISFDPEHDTPEVLTKHAAVQGARPQLWMFAVASH